MLIHLGNTPAQSHPNGIEFANRLVPTVPKHCTIPKRARPTRQFVVKLLSRIRLQMSQAFHAVTFNASVVAEGQRQDMCSRRRSVCRLRSRQCRGQRQQICRSSLIPIEAKERLRAMYCQAETLYEHQGLTRTAYRAISGWLINIG
jgi:hypothetical protein